MSWPPPEHDRDVELRDHLPEEGWRAAMQAICERHGLDEEDFAPFPTGSDVVWSAGGRVVKLTAPRWAAEIENEVRCLTKVAGRLDVDTPRVVATGELEGWPYVVMTRVPGRALGDVWPELHRRERTRLAADLGRLTRRLHAVEPAANPVSWDEHWRACRRDVPGRHAEPGVPARLVDEIAPLLASLEPLNGGAHVFLHTELLDQHVLVERRGERHELAALIDFADARAGPAEYDFPAPVEFLFRGEPGLLPAFLAAYGLGGNATPAPERLLAWGLSHRFGRLARMLQAIAPAEPASLDELARRLYGR